jgi:putative addiction module killer protein
MALVHVGLPDFLRLLGGCNFWNAAMPDFIDKPPNVLHRGQVVIVQTALFRDWLDGLRNRKARLRIDVQLKRLASGNAADSKSVGDGVQELRLHFGPVYYMWRDGVLIILLNGGDKGSQARDIAKAKQLAKDADDGIEGLPV